VKKKGLNMKFFQNAGIKSQQKQLQELILKVGVTAGTDYIFKQKNINDMFWCNLKFYSSAIAIYAISISIYVLRAFNSLLKMQALNYDREGTRTT
jgi:hypothetical protein